MVPGPVMQPMQAMPMGQQPVGVMPGPGLVPPVGAAGMMTPDPMGQMVMGPGPAFGQMQPQQQQMLLQQQMLQQQRVMMGGGPGVMQSLAQQQPMQQQLPGRPWQHQGQWRG